MYRKSYELKLLLYKDYFLTRMKRILIFKNNIVFNSFLLINDIKYENELKKFVIKKRFKVLVCYHL